MRRFPPYVKNQRGGFSLVESLVAVGIFSLLLVTIYQSTVAILKDARIYRENTTISALVDQYLEIARNLPYSQIGTLSGNPHGLLPDLPNAKIVSYNATTYKIYYEVTYVDDPADGTVLAGTDFAGNDEKQVKLSITNQTTGFSKSFLTTIVPKGLENLSSGGALYIKVFDAVGVPVSGATITITNATAGINLTRTSDSSGNWIEVGLPNGVNAYAISVTKSGYSTDRTYAISGGNPNPVKPDATIVNGQVTQVSFAIDKTSSLTIKTLDNVCAPIAGVGAGVTGTKLIGTPSVLKFNNSYTSDSNGLVSLSPIEWDTYTPSVTTTSYMIYGSSPVQQINVLPDTSQSFTMILGAKTTNAVLVIVKDSATGEPLEGATVQLHRTSSGYDSTKYTAGSVWTQNDWTGGQGQANWSNISKYHSGSGITTAGLPSAVRLINDGTNALVDSGTLVSSSFDTGTASTSYTTLTWQPTSQTASSSLSFQVAANNDNATWNFVGPDGTAGTYYTTPGSTISSSLNSKRYVRYIAYLSTTSSTTNPTLTSVGVNYVSGCFAPGQAFFSGLTAAADYEIDVSMSGYQTVSVDNANVAGYNTFPVVLSP